LSVVDAVLNYGGFIVSLPDSPERRAPYSFVGEDKDMMEMSEGTYQEIKESLDGFRWTNQQLIKHGTSANRDILAREFEQNIRKMQEALEDVWIVIEEPAV